MNEPQFNAEEIKVSGEGLLARIKEIVHEGNIRRLIIKNDDGTTLIEIPVTLGVIGIVLAPVWAAVGALAALLTECTLVVVRVDD